MIVRYPCAITLWKSCSSKLFIEKEYKKQPPELFDIKDLATNTSERSLEMYVAKFEYSSYSIFYYRRVFFHSWR